MPDDARNAAASVSAGNDCDAQVLDRVPGLIRAGRDDFAQLYNAEALAREGKDFVPLHVLVQMERLLHGGVATGSDRFAFEIAFRQAAKEKWARDLFAKVVTAGLVTVPREGPDNGRGLAEAKTYEALGKLGTPAGVEIVIDPQAAVNRADGYVDPITISREMQLAARRVCQIVIDRNRSGTGFLVGPQLVLTNWHVVHQLYTGVANPTPDAIKGRLKVVFDLHKAPGNDVAVRSSTATYIARSIDFSDPAYPQEYSGEAIAIGENSPWADNEERLDIALIRVDGTPGIERGWYTPLSDLWPKAGASVYVAQYPGQYGLKVAVGQFGALCDENSRRRVRHHANTAHGSSGGLCLGFDQQTATLKPSALHQASVSVIAAPGDANSGATLVTNQAIPLAKIAEHIARFAGQLDVAAPLLRLSAASGPDHVEGPVLGRVGFQQYVGEAVKGDVRIIVVRPSVPPGQSTHGLGKSFSEVLLRSLLAPDSHVVVSFRADSIPTDAGETARAILNRITPNAAGEGWSQPEGASTTETAWIADILIDTHFAPRLAAAAHGRLVWLVIDELDRVDLPDAGGRRFFDALYQKIASLPSLRIVLIGLSRDLPSFDLSLLRVDLLEQPPGEHEVIAWLNRRFGPGRAVDGDIVATLYRLSNELAGAPGAKTIAQAIRRVDALLPPERGLDEGDSSVGGG